MKTCFQLGRTVMTQGAADAITMQQVKDFLTRHRMGDWGCVCDEDKATNDEAVQAGFRILSAYPIDPAKPHKGYGDNVVWIITEADRSVTTILLPSEY